MDQISPVTKDLDETEKLLKEQAKTMTPTTFTSSQVDENGKSIKICPRCGKPNDTGNYNCKYCEFEFEENPSSHLDTKSEKDIEHEKDEKERIRKEEFEKQFLNGVLKENLKLFIGKNHETLYEKIENMLSDNAAIYWNWPAFGCGFFWFFYRKMNFYGFLSLLIFFTYSLGVFALFKFSILTLLLCFLPFVVTALVADPLYQKHCYRFFKNKTLATKDYHNYPKVQQAIETNGNTSLTAVIVAALFLVMLYIAAFIVWFLIMTIT